MVFWTKIKGGFFTYTKVSLVFHSKECFTKNGYVIEHQGFKVLGEISQENHCTFDCATFTLKKK